MPQMLEETKHVKPLMIPVVCYPNGSYKTDTTPIIYDLEKRHPNNRSVIPPDPALAFLSHLIEDMTDEWLTKAVFYYRFHTVKDGCYGANWVQDDARPQLTADQLNKATKIFHKRQLSRLNLVGAIEENAPILEETYKRTIRILEKSVANERFLFGSRPALADFGLIGQLTTLMSDLTPGEIMRKMAPRTESWVKRGHDLSGVDGSWESDNDILSDMISGLLEIAGDMYLPYLRANAEAIRARSKEMEIRLCNVKMRQASFGYQAKCLNWLKAEFNALSSVERNKIQPLMQDTGCWSTFSG